MATVGKSQGLFIFFLLAGGLLGGILGEILRALFPEGHLTSLFLKGYPIGLHPPLTIDLHLITFTLGFAVHINLFVFLGMFLGLFLYRQA